MAILVKPPLGEQEKFKSDNSNLSVYGPRYYLQFIKTVSDDLIQATRDFFQFNPRVPDALRWTGKFANSKGQETDETLTKIHIAHEESDNEQFYPSVLISTVRANPNDFYLGHQGETPITKPNPRFDNTKPICDQDEPPELELGFRMQGKITFAITVKVRGNTPAELDEVSDRYMHGLIGPIRRELQKKYGYAWIPNTLQFGDKSTEKYTNKSPVHVRPVSFSIMGEWFDDFYYNDVLVSDVRPNPIRDTTDIVA